MLFLVTFIDSVIHNGYFVMADNFLTNRVGIAGNLSMIVLSLGQLAEIVTMLVLGGVLARLGWKTTMIVGILGHAARFAVFAFFADSVPVIVAVQLLHGVCYAFFFATVYIFVDAAFPKDVRSSAQGLFNLLILGIGNVGASFLFPALIAHWTDPATELVDYRSLFLVPTGMAVLAVLMLALLFRPPHRGPVAETRPPEPISRGRPRASAQAGEAEAQAQAQAQAQAWAFPKRTPSQKDNRAEIRGGDAAVLPRCGLIFSRRLESAAEVEARVARLLGPAAEVALEAEEHTPDVLVDRPVLAQARRVDDLPQTQRIERVLDRDEAEQAVGDLLR